MTTHLPTLLMFSSDLETQKRHFERLKDENESVVPRGRFEIVVNLLRSIDREFPGLVVLPPESTVFAGKAPEGDLFNIGSLILAVDAATSRLRSAIERPETLGASAIADPLARLAFGTPRDLDAVTRLGVRGAFDAELPVFVQAAEEARAPMACLMIDVDDFKRVNDTYGHPQGDVVLRETAACVLEAVRGKGRAYRYGGDEFVVLIVNCADEDARGIAERIRLAVHELRLPPIETSIGMTIGAASVFAHECDPAELVRRADAALLAAKNQGKGRTHVFDEKKEPTTERTLPIATPDETTPIAEWLESASWEVRRDAARDLADLARARQLFPLEPFHSVPRRLLKDSHQEVRLIGLEIVGAIIGVAGEQASAYYRRALIEVVEGDDDFDVRARAIATIGNSGDIRFVEQVCDWIAKWQPASYTRVWPVAALIGLARRHGAHVRHTLRHRLESAPSTEERARFAEALKEVRSVA